MTPIHCDTCAHWDPNLIRYRGKPERLCLCQHSADYRRYVNAYHTCHWHSAIMPDIRIDLTEEQLNAMAGEMREGLTPAHIDELVTLRSDARLAAENYTEAIAAQSERTGISKSALRRYINAKEKDALDSLHTENDDLINLLEMQP